MVRRYTLIALPPYCGTNSCEGSRNVRVASAGAPSMAPPPGFESVSAIVSSGSDAPSSTTVTWNVFAAPSPSAQFSVPLALA